MKMLIGAHKMKRIASVFTFSEQYHKDGHEFLSHIIRVTGDETLFLFVNTETKKLSNKWMHIQSPNKCKKFKQTLSARKLMVAVFWDRKGVLMVAFILQGTKCQKCIAKH
jgi:hypothetical protein